MLQTTRTEYKETLIQTTNQPASMTPDGPRAMTPCHSPPSTQTTSFQQSHCTPVCPASVLILRSGNSCCGTLVNLNYDRQFLNEKKKKKGSINYVVFFCLF